MKPLQEYLELKKQKQLEQKKLDKVTFGQVKDISLQGSMANFSLTSKGLSK